MYGDEEGSISINGVCYVPIALLKQHYTCGICTRMRKKYGTRWLYYLVYRSWNSKWHCRECDQLLGTRCGQDHNWRGKNGLQHLYAQLGVSGRNAIRWFLEIKRWEQRFWQEGVFKNQNFDFSIVRNRGRFYVAWVRNFACYYASQRAGWSGQSPKRLLLVFGLFVFNRPTAGVKGVRF